MSGIQHAPAADRNKAPILAVLARVLPARGRVLEVASGTGQHVVHFAAALPALEWIPSDPDPEQRASIVARTARAGLDNVADPLDLDVLGGWRVPAVDAVVTANLLHVADRSALPGLCRGAAAALTAAGVMHVYGPFKQGGRHTSPSNARFDEALRTRQPGWGLWDVEAVADSARDHGFELMEIVAMPANNLSLVFGRS